MHCRMSTAINKTNKRGALVFIMLIDFYSPSSFSLWLFTFRLLFSSRKVNLKKRKEKNEEKLNSNKRHVTLVLRSSSLNVFIPLYFVLLIKYHFLIYLIIWFFFYKLTYIFNSPSFFFLLILRLSLTIMISSLWPPTYIFFFHIVLSLLSFSIDDSRSDLIMFYPILTFLKQFFFILLFQIFIWTILRLNFIYNL